MAERDVVIGDVHGLEHRRVNDPHKLEAALVDKANATRNLVASRSKKSPRRPDGPGGEEDAVAWLRAHLGSKAGELGL